MLHHEHMHLVEFNRRAGDAYACTPFVNYLISIYVNQIESRFIKRHQKKKKKRRGNLPITYMHIKRLGVYCIRLHIVQKVGRLYCIAPRTQESYYTCVAPLPLLFHIHRNHLVPVHCLKCACTVVL